MGSFVLDDEVSEQVAARGPKPGLERTRKARWGGSVEGLEFRVYNLEFVWARILRVVRGRSNIQGFGCGVQGLQFRD